MPYCSNNNRTAEVYSLSMMIEILSEDSSGTPLQLVLPNKISVVAGNKHQSPDPVVEMASCSLLDEKFTLRELIANRFSIEDKTSTSANLVFRSILESLIRYAPDRENDEGLESILRRALVPSETENAF